MKKLLMALALVACAFGAQANDGTETPAWKMTLAKVKNMWPDTGICSFLKPDAPDYITGKFETKDAQGNYVDRPEAKPFAANRNGYYDKDCNWVGGYFDDVGAFVKGHEVKTLFGMPYGSPPKTLTSWPFTNAPASSK